MPLLTEHAASDVPPALVVVVAARASGWEDDRKLVLIHAAEPSQTTWLQSPSVVPVTSTAWANSAVATRSASADGPVRTFTASVVHSWPVTTGSGSGGGATSAAGTTTIFAAVSTTGASLTVGGGAVRSDERLTAACVRSAVGSTLSGARSGLPSAAWGPVPTTPEPSRVTRPRAGSLSDRTGIVGKDGSRKERAGEAGAALWRPRDMSAPVLRGQDRASVTKP